MKAYEREDGPALAAEPPAKIEIPESGPEIARWSNILNIEELARFKNLLVFAQSEVEGFFAGKHRSRFHGGAAEFSEYKEYGPGEDVERVDWRRYGRTRRLFVRRFHEETDMVVYVMVDTSGSMAYTGEGRQPKFLFAAKIAAALSYLMLKQGDKAALALFAEHVSRYLKAGGTRRHLYEMVAELERVKPSRRTGVAQAVEDCHLLFKKRGRLVIISDFLDNQGRLFDALARFTERGFEVLLLQVLDPDELDLPWVDSARFVDLENGCEITLEPAEIRKAYERGMREFIQTLEIEANRRRMSYRLVRTTDRYTEAIEAYLGFREAL